MTFATKRLSKELIEIKKNDIEGIELIDTEDIFIWKVSIDGPKESAFEDGKFALRISFDEKYPIKAPSVKFLTEMFHPNIYKDGKICVDILQSEWSPSQNVETVLQSIRSLLLDPNPNSPANRDAANLYTRNKELYYSKVKDIITQVI